MIIGFISGCFDDLHCGHRFILSEAKSQCDELIVAVNDDDYIRRAKGREPMVDLDGRILAVENCGVDYVFSFSEETPIDLIMEFEPDIIFVGDDYPIEKVVGAEECAAWGGRVEIIKRIPGYSSSEIYAKSRSSSGS